MKRTYEGWEGITPELEKTASATYMSITSYSPRQELGGIDREWIELKIAEAIRDYHLHNFQSGVNDWMMSCFGKEIADNRTERNYRFLEEALELVQSNGCTKEDAYRLVDYVYGRPAGELEQECGGVMVTLAALAEACGISMDDCGNIELVRVWGKIEQIREKQATKKIKAGPLP